MSDILFGNNNRAVVKKLTKRCLVSNKRRNAFIITAITLTTLLLASVFSIGMSFLSSQKKQQVRLMGTASHAAVTQPSLAELEQLNNLDYVKAIGIGNNVATINNTPIMGDMNLSLYYFNKTEWEELRVPAYTDIVGSYPQKENEIMVPYWILERMEIDPKIGMEIPISYKVETNGEYTQYDEIFLLSGWFTSYMHIRSGNIDSIKVSELFSIRHGKNVETDGAASLVFENSSKVNEYCRLIEHDLNISESNRVRPVPMYDVNSSDSTSTFIALLFIVAFLVLIGYLLIYNVLYISVARDVRFYGLLKTIGTTPGQIHRIVTGQIFRLCAIGIPLGMTFAALLSFAIIPALVSGMSNITTGAVVSFSPLIYIGSAFFAFLTAFLGAAKPAKTAACVSPVEAQKYTSAEVKKSVVHSSAHGKPYRMALRNVFRDRKRAVIVLLSLFLGITTFITVTTLVTSMNTDNYVAFYVNNDFTLTNNTMSIGSDSEAKQKFDDAFLSTISAISGFEKMQYDTMDMFRLTYTDDFDMYLKQHLQTIPNQKEELTPESFLEIKEGIKENFSCIAVGVDSGVLTELEGKFDAEAFENGEYLLLATRNPSLLDAIESVELHSGMGGDAILTIPVGGFTPAFFHNNGFSSAPTLIMSNSLMERLTGGAMRSRLYIDVAEGYDAQFLDSLKALTDGDYEISRISKIEASEDLSGVKIMLYVLGGGISLVLGLIGILNFINVMSVGIVVRKREFAILKSIGMSRKQTQVMLLCEGAGYAIITLTLVGSLGNAIVYGVFKLFQQQASYAVFSYPIIPVAITALAILIVCIATPETVYRSFNKASIVERLREAE